MFSWMNAKDIYDRPKYGFFGSEGCVPRFF